MKHNYLLIDNEKYKDEYSYKGVLTAPFYVYELDNAGAYYFDANNQTFSTSGSGSKYSRKAVNMQVMTSDVAIQAALASSDVVFYREKSLLAGTEFYIKMNPTMNPCKITYAGNGNYVFQDPLAVRTMNGDQYITVGETCSFSNNVVRLDGSRRYFIARFNIQQPVGASIRFKAVVDTVAVDKFEILAVEVVDPGRIFDEGGADA